ncbi:MAG: hypothetical protein ACLFUJ_03245 [Phycisphaerae bacterium]
MKMLQSFVLLLSVVSVAYGQEPAPKETPDGVTARAIVLQPDLAARARALHATGFDSFRNALRSGRDPVSAENFKRIRIVALGSDPAKTLAVEVLHVADRAKARDLAFRAAKALIEVEAARTQQHRDRQMHRLALANKELSRQIDHSRKEAADLRSELLSKDLSATVIHASKAELARQRVQLEVEKARVATKLAAARKQFDADQQISPEQAAVILTSLSQLNDQAAAALERVEALETVWKNKGAELQKIQAQIDKADQEVAQLLRMQAELQARRLEVQLSDQDEAELLGVETFK